MSCLDKIKENFANKEVTFKDNMILSKGQPHTPPVAHLTEHCSGVVTAEYYLVSRYFDLIDDAFAQNIVAELKKLQNTDKNDRAFGCMRWYREEEFVFDTNGAFFILLPLALAYKLCGDKLSEKEKADIKELLANASVWFSHAAEGSLHYCNKIMSDGAMLALIADITGECKKECETFWTKWNKYFDEYGWGWGENSSDCYSTIMFNALNAVIISTTGKLKKKAIKVREQLLDYIAFHEGNEFIPSIRTYNFEADANYGGLVYAILSEAEDLESKMVSANVPASLAAILIETSGAKLTKNNKGKVRSERLFKDSYAYTYKGENVRLGSVSRFPVMPCSYQNETEAAGGRRATYGLAWQTMPLSAMLDENIGFLRIRTKVGENEHSHPTTNKHEGHLFNRVFEDGNIAVFSTISAQKNNIAVVSRYANKIANTASFICDEWCIAADIKEVKAGDKTWYVTEGKESAIAILPLDGVSADDVIRKPLKTYISENGKFSTVTSEFYNGENKLVFAHRLESAWVVVAIEDVKNVKSYLEKIEVCDRILPNFEITLNPEYERRTISCNDGQTKVELYIDPTSQHDF